MGKKEGIVGVGGGCCRDAVGGLWGEGLVMLGGTLCLLPGTCSGSSTARHPPTSTITRTTSSASFADGFHQPFENASAWINHRYGNDILRPSHVFSKSSLAPPTIIKFWSLTDISRLFLANKELHRTLPRIRTRNGRCYQQL